LRLADRARLGRAKLCRGPEGHETFLLCRSADRREKEKAMHERFSRRIELRLERLALRLERSRQRLDRETIGRQIGRLLGQNSRAAGRYQIQVLDDATRDSGLRPLWSARSEWDERARHSEGTYILRTNVSDWTTEELWRTYIQLTEAEAAFRIPRERALDPARLAPEGRTGTGPHPGLFPGLRDVEDARAMAEACRVGQQPRTILEELGRIQSLDVVAPIADDPQREFRLRCVVRPDKAQALLLDRLGLELPERLRIPPNLRPT
jgi:hypothetical protein